jgi:PAS domain S-box-containing protein
MKSSDIEVYSMFKSFEEKIKQLEKKHRIIADNLIDAIWSLDVETQKFDYITPSIERVSGYTADEYMNFTLQETLTPESFQKVTAILTEEIPRFEQGVKRIRTLELEFLHKNGNTYWAEIRAKFIKEAGNSLKIIGVTREISDWKKAEQQQNKLIKRLGEALAEKKRLLKEVKTLRGLLPICSGCKRIRDENGKWWPLDAYVNARTEAELTHTICSDCKDVFYPDM